MVSVDTASVSMPNGRQPFHLHDDNRQPTLDPTRIPPRHADCFPHAPLHCRHRHRARARAYLQMQRRSRGGMGHASEPRWGVPLPPPLLCKSGPSGPSRGSGTGTLPCRGDFIGIVSGRVSSVADLSRGVVRCCGKVGWAVEGELGDDDGVVAVGMWGAGMRRREKGLVNKVAVEWVCCRGIFSDLGLGSEVRTACFGARHVDERCPQLP